MSVRGTTAFAAGAVVALVLGTGTAYAANGGTFKLGVGNSATRTTTLTNTTGGAALTLNVKAGQPPLAVNQTTRVPRLNADLLDGVDSASLARVTRVGTVTATGVLADTDNDGTPDLLGATATCPAGSQVVGGGAGDFTADGFAVVSAPDGTDTWLVLSSADPATADPADLDAYARCWNPRANVADQAATAGVNLRGLTPQNRALARKVAQR